MKISEKYDEEELAAWIRLQMTPGVGILTAHKMLSAYGLPQNIFTTPYEEIARIVSPKMADVLYAPVDPAITEQIEKTYRVMQQLSAL